MKIIYLFLIVFSISLYSQNKLIVNFENGSSEEIILQDIERVEYSSTFIPLDYLETNNIYVKVGETTPLTYTYYPANTSDTNFIFTIANEEIATVDSEGNVTGISEGLTDITIKGILMELLVAVNVEKSSSVKINSAKFKIYPNPVDNVLNISIEGHALFEVNIIDAKGELVYSNYTQTEIDISNFTAGAYTLVINQNNQYYSYKFIKK